MLLQVGGGGVVGRTLGQLAPLFAFAAPVKEIRAGEHELVAVVAVEVPGAGTADTGIVRWSRDFDRAPLSLDNVVDYTRFRRSV